MSSIDSSGNIHRPAGTAGGGQFAGKSNTAPAGGLADSEQHPAVASTLPITPPSDGEVRAASMSVELRSGEREVSDATAAVIARDALTNLPADAGGLSDYPMLQRVAGFPSYHWSEEGNERQVDELHAELGRLYSNPNLPYGRKQRVNALFTFALHGGDLVAALPQPQRLRAHAQKARDVTHSAHHRRMRRPRLCEHPQRPLTHLRRILPVHRVPSLLEERNESQADSA